MDTKYNVLINEAASDMGWNAYFSDDYIEFNYASGMGEDFSFSVPYSDSIGEAIAEYAEGFDIDEHVAAHIGFYGSAPYSIELFVDNADRYFTRMEEIMFVMNRINYEHPSITMGDAANNKDIAKELDIYITDNDTVCLPIDGIFEQDCRYFDKDEKLEDVNRVLWDEYEMSDIEEHVLDQLGVSDNRETYGRPGIVALIQDAYDIREDIYRLGMAITDIDMRLELEKAKDAPEISTKKRETEIAL